MTPIDESDAADRHEDFQRSLVGAILEASPDGMLVVDEREVIVAHNQRLFALLGVDPADLPGGQESDLSGRADPPLLARVLELVKEPKAFLTRVQALYANPELEDHCEIELKDGRTLERHSRALWNSEAAYLGRVWFFRDITRRKDSERTLQDLSHRDPLTGAANRRHFFERADVEVARSRRWGIPLSFAMLDVDYFKQINDRWGHAAGDRVLLELCASVDPVLRQEDLFARMGGEEFAILLPETALDGAVTVAERIRSKVAADGSGDLSYTVSTGVAELMPADASARHTLQRADAALYEAKRAGRNRTHASQSADV